MRFSKTELKLLEQVALGRNNVIELADALKKDKSQIYRMIRSLENKGFLRLKNKIIEPSPTTHVQLLLQELSRQPSFIEDISGCGLKLYQSIRDKPKSIREIEKATGIRQGMVFHKFRIAKKKSLVKKIGKKYNLNSELWRGLAEFLRESERYEQAYDKRIPPGSVIYHKTDQEIVFSTKAECDATLTGFSAYGMCGLKIHPIDHDYCLPKRRLKINDVFIHSIYRCEKDMSAQNLLLLTLFYLKHKLPEIHREIIDNIDKALQGESIEGYPTLREIRDRAEIYDIQIRRHRQAIH
jgi:hypothetical protein